MISPVKAQRRKGRKKDSALPGALAPLRVHDRVTLRKTLVSCALLAFALLLAVILLSLVGSEPLPAKASLCALLSFGTSPCGLSQDQFDILFQIRLPRIVLAAAVGGSLATAGASYQALLRNPLAEPYLLGISNGAAVGTMVALVFFGANEWSRPVLAFAGSLLATFAVYRLARDRKSTRLNSSHSQISYAV